MREAWYEAQKVACYTLPWSTPQPEPNVPKAAQYIHRAQAGGVASRSFSSNLVLLQSILLLAIAADNRGSGPKGYDEPSQSYWLGAAVGLAYELQLHETKQLAKDDHESDETLARRIWLSLVVMDKWHASSRSCPTMIPDGSVQLTRKDQTLLGESVWHFTRKLLFHDGADKS